MDDSVPDLVARWLELRDRGDAPDPGPFAARHPWCEVALRQALEDLISTEERIPRRAGVPDRIGRWRIVRVLGTGGSGAVFEACAVGDEARRAAIKVLAPARAGDERARSRLKREASVLIEEPHRNVVRVLDADADAPMPWLAMELIEGPTLRDLIARARALTTRGDLPRCAGLAWSGPGDPFARVARCGLGIADALAWAHARGIVHRDVKPGNVILRKDGDPVLVDFGLASDPGATALTHTGDVIGTPAYMAPEQALGRRAGPAADVYGLGAILFELVTLRPPFEGAETSEVLRKIRTSVSPRVRRIDPFVPVPLASVIEAALAPRPRGRPRSAEAMAEDLRRFLSGLSVSSRPPSGAARLLWRVAGRPLVAVGSLAAVLLVATAVLFFLRAADTKRRAAALELAVDRAALAVVEPLGTRGIEGCAREILAIAPASALPAFLLDLAAGRSPGPSSDPAVGRLVAAERARLVGDHHGSLRELEAALDDPGTGSVAWALAPRMVRDGGSSGGLLGRLEAACAADPDRPALRAALGHLLVIEKRHGDAAAAFARARASAPEPGLLAFHEACALDRAGRKGESLRAAREGGGDVLVRLGRLLDRENRRPEAWSVYREALAGAPDRIDARFHLATSLAAAEEVEEAAEAYREVLARDPKHAPSLVSLAWLHAWVCGHERCRRVRDPGRAVEFAAAAVRADGGKERAILITATRIARHLDARPALRAVIAEVVGESRARGRDTALLEDGLRELDAP